MIDPRKGTRLSGTSLLRGKNVGSLCLSLGLHAAALAWALHTTMSMPAGTEPAPVSVHVEILEAAVEETPPPTVQPLPPPPPHPEIKPATKQEAKPVKPAVQDKPLSHKAEPAQTAPIANAAVSETAARADISSAEDAPAVHMEKAVPGTPAPQDALRLYNMDVWARILSRKPSRIRLRGTVTLTFSIAQDGALTASAVSQSSGSAILDEVALDALRQAAPFPPPPGHGTAPIAFTIPFEFR